MTKTLRLGFVMGGGVSLGTFSGAALSEALKQLIVYGQYESDELDAEGKSIKKPYDKIEIDVFSGASAGAISLGIMLRVLTNHRDKFKLMGFSSYEAFREMLEKKLFGQFTDAAMSMKYNNPEKFECLVGAQAVQEFQEKIWSQEVNIEKLMGSGNYQKDLTNIPGLIDRTVVDELGRNYFKFQESNPLQHKVLLADRVLFGCTLANLNYIVKRQRGQDNSEGKFLKALNDTSVNRVHSELRVFDLNFGEINPATLRYYPLKWVQFHDGEPLEDLQQDAAGKTYKKIINNLSDNKSWREITASSIASGAFPFAFEPVVLNRYRHEFGIDWPEELADKDQFCFTYVDGGTFNNEPIKEGMRLASYIDNINNHVAFDRVMIFVDPLVGELETQFRVRVHNNMGISRSLLSGKAKTTQKSTLFRLLNKVPHMLAAILNEAQSIELNKISWALEQFENQKRMRKFYKQCIGLPSSDQTIDDLRQFVVAELDDVRARLNLPPNTLQIQHELIRILNEESEYFKDHLPIEDRLECIDAIQEFVYTSTPSELPNIRYWLVALSCVALDIAMNLTGKTANARIVPISSFNFYDKEKEYELLALPGSGIAGFAGFASQDASEYEVRYGHYCAYRILKDMGLTAGHLHEMTIPAAFDYSLFNDGVKNDLKNTLLKRFKEMVPNEYGAVLPFLEGMVQNALQRFIEDNIDKSKQKIGFEFRIEVPNDIFSLRGYSNSGNTSSKNSLEPIQMNGKYYLVASLNYSPIEHLWYGEYVGPNSQKLSIDKMGLFDNKPMLGIELPRLDNGHEAFLSPNPIFSLDAKVQLSVSGYSELKAQNWRLWTDIRPLDESLWA